MIVNIFIEWFVMKYVNIYYENRLIKNYKREIEEEKIVEAKNKAENKETEPNNKEVKIFKYQRIYYHDRRKKIEKRMKENKIDDVNIYSSTNRINIVSN